jgi:hypothetical protein
MASQKRQNRASHQTVGEKCFLGGPDRSNVSGFNSNLVEPYRRIDSCKRIRYGINLKSKPFLPFLKLCELSLVGGELSSKPGALARKPLQ